MICRLFRPSPTFGYNTGRVQPYGWQRTSAPFLKALTMARRYKIQSIWIHQSYDVSEVADLLGVTHRTVRVWINAGLPILATQRPVLILGCELWKYLKDRDAKAKCPAALGEFYCMRCRKPQKPFVIWATLRAIAFKPEPRPGSC